MLNPVDAGEISTEDASANTIVRGTADSETSITRDHQQQNIGSSTNIEIPETCGRYAIQKVLGQGAMGAVYLAKDTQLDRDVALKIPKFGDGNGVDDEELLERFYREARASATIRSLNICPVHDVGEIDGQHYITMAYIEGRPLKDFTKSKKSHSEKQIITTIRKLALGLEEAHKIGVVHRDLKPANIMVDQKGEPVVMDFGLARRSASDDVQVTQSGAILGTPAYMAPEQVAGDQAAIDHRVDIYALGIIMYELITGEMPFKGNLMSILQQIALNNPTKPSELRKNIDPRLEAICLKMMAGDQAKRYQSMTDVANDLQDVLRNPGKRQKKEQAKKTGPTPTSIPSANEESNPALISVAQPKSYAEQLRTKKGKTSKNSKSSTKVPHPSPVDANGNNNKKYLIAGGLGGLILLLGIVFIVRLGKYDVKITLDDPSIQLSVDGIPLDELKITDGEDVYKLSAGEHKLKLQKEGLTTHVEEFTVTKDGKTALRAAIVGNKLEGLLNGEEPPVIPQENPQQTLAAIDKGLTRGLVGHWNFEEGQGTMAGDTSGYGNHGKLFTTETNAWSDETPPSAFAGRHSFRSQKTNHIEIPDSRSLDIKDQITIAFWAKYSAGNGTILNKGYNLAFAVSSVTSDRYRWQIAQPMDADRSRPTEDVFVECGETSGKWTHFTASYDGQEIRWLVNGKLLLSKPYTVPLQTSDLPLILGNKSPEPTEAGGLLDDIRIYNRVLTEVEIRRLANQSQADTGFGIWKAEPMNGSESAQSPASSDLNFPASSFGENKAASSISAPPGFSLYFDGTQEVGASLQGKFKHEGSGGLQQLTIEGDFFIPKNPKSRLSAVFAALGTHHAGGSQMQGISQWAETLGVWSRGGGRRGNVKLPLDKPINVAFVFDGKEARFYINGKLEFSAADSRELRNEHIHLGTWNYKGWMKNVRFSSVARYKENYTPQSELQVDDQTFGYYRCDERVGYILNDSSQYKNDLFIHGAKWVKASSGQSSSMEQQPKFPGGLEFDGDDVVNIDSLEFDPTKPFTLEAAFSWKYVKDVTHEAIFAGRDGSSQNSTGGARFETRSHNHVSSRLGEVSIKTGSVPEKAERVHLALVHTGQELLSFRDGILFGREPTTRKDLGPGTGRFLIGKEMVGRYEMFRFSTTARYDKDFTPQTRFTPDKSTLALYHFDEGRGDVLKDSSGNGYDGKVVGAKWVSISSPVVDAERAVAEWIIAAGGRVSVNLGQNPSYIKWLSKVEELPESNLRVVGVALKPKDENLEWHTCYEKLKILKNLRHLSLSNARHWNGACLEDIVGLPLLTGLEFFGVSITDADLKRHLTKMPKLEHLRLSCEGITDEGMVHLQELKNLKTLTLFASGVGDDGMKVIGQLKSLNELNLGGTQTTDAGLIHLESLQNLTYIYLKGTQTTADGEARLKQALPKCIIGG